MGTWQRWKKDPIGSEDQGGHGRPGDGPGGAERRLGPVGWSLDELDRRAERADRDNQDPAGAVRDWKALVAGYTRVCGPDHRVTLGARGNLAAWRRRAGDLAGAIRDLESVVADRATLGADHPDTLDSQHDLAYWQGEARDAAGAIRALETVVADRTRVLGADHPDPLASRHLLAYWRGKAGDTAGAIRDFESVAADHTRVQGSITPTR